LTRGILPARVVSKTRIFFRVSSFFALQAKHIAYQRRNTVMRQLRKLEQGVWYEIRTRINNREPLFRRARALRIFARVFRETMLRFVFEVRGLHLEDDWLTFYIKPEDGFELPEIMKWMKQVFAQRYNAAAGRIGHIWGDRYWSRILEGEPPEGEGEAAAGDRPCGRGAATGVRPCRGRNEGGTCFSLIPPFLPAPPPG
jgi:REP element-mobilizing transposase RayT